jgi:hypothetical protein
VPAAGGEIAQTAQVAQTTGSTEVLRPIALTGLAGAIGVAVASLVGGPEPLALYLTAARTGPGSVGTLLCFYGGLALLVRAWFRLRRVVVEERPPVRPLLVVIALWSLPLLLAPPVASRDLYAYTAQGTMVAEGLDPYLEGPEVLGEGPVLDAVDPLWRNTAVPYGPSWLAVAAVAAEAPGPQPHTSVMILKLYQVGGLVLLAWGARVLASRLGRDPDDALVLAVANPIVLVHGIGGGHNDLLLVALVVGALALAADRRHLLALVLVGLAAGIKVPAILVAGHIGWVGMIGSDTLRSLPRRALAAALATGVSLAVLALTGVVTGLGFGWVGALDVGERARSFLAPATWAGLPFGEPELFHGAFRVASVVLAGAILLTGRRWGIAMAPGLALLALGLLGPIVHPWYLLWGLPLVAIAMAGAPAKWLLGATAAATLLCHPGDSELLFALARVDPVLIVGAVCLALVLLDPSRCQADAIESDAVLQRT